jgi:DNA-binding MarR family transcriptional regulator
MSSVTPEALGLLIKRIQHAHHRCIDERLTPLNLSLVQWNALREINRNPQEPLRQLARLTFNSDQAFGALVTRLLARGYVRRRPGFGRATIHELTPLGQSLLRKADAIVHEVLTQSFAALSGPEKEVLHTALGKILQAQQDLILEEAGPAAER